MTFPQAHATAMASTALMVTLVSSAGAAPVELTIDQSRSSATFTVTIDAGFGPDSDTDSSTVSGMMTIEFDDAGAPGEATLLDFDAMFDSALEFSLVPAPLSTASATLDGGAVMAANPGVGVGPVPVAGGSVLFPAVPTALSGTLDAQYNIFLVGSGSEMIDLSTLPEAAEDIDATVTVMDSVLEVSTTIAVDVTQPLMLDETEVGTVRVVGTTTVVATAEIPGCPADLTGDGTLDFFDLSAYLTAFGAQDPSADLTGDGSWDFFDLSAYLALFGAGCP